MVISPDLADIIHKCTIPHYGLLRGTLRPGKSADVDRKRTLIFQLQFRSLGQFCIERVTGRITTLRVSHALVSCDVFSLCTSSSHSPAILRISLRILQSITATMANPAPRINEIPAKPPLLMGASSEPCYTKLSKSYRVLHRHAGLVPV